MTTRRWRPTREAWVVLALLLVGQVALFGGYWAGAITPPWDFYSSYNTESFAWWRDGTFFDPPVWMPFLWGGYPAVAPIQNSSYYLPVGLVAEVGTFTIHAAAALQAAHVALGALGAYVLVRRWIGPGAPAYLALIAYTFAGPFFTNASHPDIVRATAWLPWVVLLASPRWPWRRWWSVPVAAVVLWQFAVSAYPGVLVVGVYAVAAGLVVWQVTARPRPRDFLLPLTVSGVAALALSLVKYLPNVLIRGAPTAVQPPDPADHWGVLGTLFFGHHLDFLFFYDVTMRSVFVVAPVLLLAVFAPLRSDAVRVAATMTVVAVVLAVPALSPVTGQLPGMALSRFHLMGGRTVALAPIIVLGAAGLTRLLAGRVHRLRWVALAGVPALAGVLAVIRPFGPDEWAVPVAVLLVGCALVAFIAARTRRERGTDRWRSAGVGALLALTVVSGADWAADSAGNWQVSRLAWETDLWGATSDELIAGRVDPGPAERRPARTAPWIEDRIFTYEWSSAFFTGNAIVAGTSGLRGNPAFEALSAAAQDPGRAWVGDFFAAPGLLVPPALAADAAALADCAATGACGPGLHVTPAGYLPGEHHYRVAATEPIEVVLNEPYYPGWSLTACSSGCRDLPVTMAEHGAITTEVPAGTWYLVLLYETPGQAVAWRFFAAGVALALAYPLVGMVRGLWRSRGRPGDGSDADGGEGDRGDDDGDDSGDDGEGEELLVTFYPPVRA